MTNFESDKLMKKLFQLFRHFSNTIVANILSVNWVTVVKYESHRSDPSMEMKYSLELFINHKPGHERSFRTRQFRLHGLSL